MDKPKWTLARNKLPEVYTRVLGWDARRGHSICCVLDAKSGTVFWSVNGCNGPGVRKPTKWMPLPDA